ncbi:transcriptional regulator-domain-containing protein [Cladochytrium replicatum]|nr:transcriptional regulator-domain-containing protein [Cladochytrium replicatum]
MILREIVHRAAQTKSLTLLARGVNQIRNAGHNKWSKIKRDKGATDAERGRLFARISKQIIAAIRSSGDGSDPRSNLYLAAALALAKQNQMPKVTMEKAIAKGSGKDNDAEGNSVEVVYEAIGPGRVGMLIEAMSANRNRTIGDMRTVFSKFGEGCPGLAGKSAYLFKRRGKLVFSEAEKVGGHADWDYLRVVSVDGVEDLGAEGFARDENGEEVPTAEVFCEFEDMAKVKAGIEEMGFKVREMSKVYLTDQDKVPVLVNEMEDSGSVEELEVTQKEHHTLIAEFATELEGKALSNVIRELEDLEDVVAVHHNARWVQLTIKD